MKLMRPQSGRPDHNSLVYSEWFTTLFEAGETFPAWTAGIQRKGAYYEGTVEDVDDMLLCHKQMTVTTFGTQRSETFSS